MTSYDVPLVNLYRERRMVSLGDPPRGENLRTRCERAAACWEHLGAEAVPPEGTAAAELSPPWVGSSYEIGRTVVVMENLRHYGGFDLLGTSGRGMRHLGMLAREQLAGRRRRLFASGTYRGTDVWPRALDYAALWLGAVGVIGVGASSPASEVEQRITALDHVAIVQHVKCSPATRGSEQPRAMWANCGQHVLAHELAILRPRRLVVLGTGDNARAMWELVLRRPARVIDRATLRIGQRVLAVTVASTESPWGAVDVLVAPHPAGRGGNARGLLARARELFGRMPSASATAPT